MKKILVIDDDDQVRSTLRRILERSRFKVIEACNGKEGIEICLTGCIDLIITDMIMPEKEGLETIRELIRKFSNLHIIAISGGGIIGPEDYLHFAEKLGAKRTLTKPLEQKVLLNAVHELIGE